RALPNCDVWCSNELTDSLGPAYGSPGFATHAYAALFDCGRELGRSARKDAPRTTSIAVITNAGEPRLDNRFTYRLVESWRRHGASVESFQFPAADQLTHDLIDPGNAAQKTDYVYPIVTRYIEGG